MNTLVIESRNIVKEKWCERHSDEWQSGVWCFFRKLDTDKTWGIKCYTSKDDRDICYARQKLAAKHGLAPKVGGKMYSVVNGQRIYCFITQVVTTTREYMQIHRNYDWYEDEQYSQLRTDLEKKCKLDGCDMHSGNIGFIGDKMVCIDFSHMSKIWS